jgi:hypothetical protein
MIKVILDLEDGLFLVLQQLTKRNRLMRGPSSISTTMGDTTPAFPHFLKVSDMAFRADLRELTHYLDGRPSSYYATERSPTDRPHYITVELL